MAEASLWHRLNPFHHRPASGGPPTPLYKHRAISADNRTSFADSSAPLPHDNDLRASAVYTPSFPSPPPKRSHARTPSLLRSLAQRPSFPTLKSHSKKSRRKTAFRRSPIPPMPDLEVKDSLDIHGADDERGYELSPSPRKYRQASGLSGARSIPRDLRINSKAPNGRPSMDQDPFHPVPSPHELAFDFGNVSIFRPKQHRREASVTSGIQRKPPPVGLSVGSGGGPSFPSRFAPWVPSGRETPDVMIDATDLTPESVRFRRMRFRLDLNPNASPPNLAGLSASTASNGPRRRDRSASTSEVIEESPSKSRPPNLRHLSSPAPPPSACKAQCASAQYPFTTQHPHPVPLTASPRAPYDNSPTFHALPGEDDFIPLTESGRTQIFEDGLQALVTDQAIPAGTPGGTWTDLRHGAFVDGSRHAMNATRFFSRDLYEPMSATPSPASVKPLNIPPATEVASSEDRSESPFEVKLSPTVTKRMSLHAFGAVATSLAAGSEELVDDYEAMPTPESQEIETAVDQADKPDLTGLQDSPNEPDTSNRPAPTPLACEETKCYTPFSAPQSAQQRPLLPDDSTFHPAARRQYASCPPLPVTQPLLRAQDDHAKALSHELDCAKRLIKEMEGELRDAKKRLEHADSGNDMEQALLVRMQELEDLLAERDQEFDEINSQIETQAKEHGLTVAQLRGALEANEGYFDTLQQAHDHLADKLANLEAELVDLTIDRDRAVAALEQTRNEVHQLRAELLQRAAERSNVERAIVDLQRDLQLAEEQVAQQKIGHQQAVDAKVMQLETLRAELDEIRQVLRERDERVAELEDLLRAGLEREGEIARLTAMLKTRDDRIAELEHRQTERQRALHERDEDVAGKEAAMAGLKHHVGEVESEMAKLQKDLKATLQSVSAKDMIIGVLRDRQRTAAYQRDEIVAAGLAERREDEASKEAMREEIEQLRGEIEALQNQAKQSRRLAVKQEKAEAAWTREREERLKESGDAQAELQSVRQQLRAAMDELETVQHDLTTAHGDLDELLAEDEAHVELLRQQEAELIELRAALYEAEESAEDLGDGFLRRAQQAEEFCEELRKRIDDVREEMQARDEAVSKAMLEAEMERATASDLRSRLATYTAEVDRLSLANAELKKEVEDVRRNSANGGLRLIELEKKAKALQEDKEMLHVALESKEIELELLQRQLGKGTPATRPRPLAASTSRLADVTPVPVRKLGKSASHTSLRAHHRAASASATPTPTPHSCSNLATPRARAFGTPSPMPLGASSRHNQTPGPRVVSKKVMSGTPSVVTPAIKRRSSLPVLKGSSLDLGRSAGPDMGRVREEDEA